MKNLTKQTFQKRKENYQPNTITKSKQTFSLQEQKIVAFVINQIDHTAQYIEGQNLIFEIPLTELASQIRYEDIKKVANTIRKKEIFMEDENGFVAYNIFPFVEYKKKEGILEILLLSKSVSLFLGLNKEYTKYPLEVFLSLSSVYSQRFYQLIMMFLGRKQKTFRYEFDKLQTYLNCSYRDFYDFKKRVLETAQKELKEKVDLNFGYVPSKKEGKKIVEIEFTIKSHIDLALDSVENEAKTFFQHSPSERNTYIKNLLVAYKFPVKLQQQITENPEALAHFMQLESEIANGIRKNINNVAAYIAKSMREFLKLSKN